MDPIKLSNAVQPLAAPLLCELIAHLFARLAGPSELMLQSCRFVWQGRALSGAEGEEMTGAARRQSNWTAEEDRRLLELVEARKSWVFISANLKRPERSARERFAYLQRKERKPD
jgi:hypothetical protein